jgi:hypothetical protein
MSIVAVIITIKCTVTVAPVGVVSWLLTRTPDMTRHVRVAFNSSVSGEWRPLDPFVITSSDDSGVAAVVTQRLSTLYARLMPSALSRGRRRDLAMLDVPQRMHEASVCPSSYSRDQATRNGGGPCPGGDESM